MEGSKQWFKRARAVAPGGVNSPARGFAAVGRDFPQVMVRGQGAFLVDVEGRRYIDYLAAFGPMILGHAHPKITEAICRAAESATVLGTPTVAEIELAEELVSAIEGLEQVRLTSTGTEAVMSAVRLARAYTGRSLIVKFEGAYHGHADAMLVKAGSGAATVGTADSLGVPSGVTEDVVSLPFNDIGALRDFFNHYGDRVAAVLAEPIVGNMGIVMPMSGYLQDMKQVAHRYGALLIFDEVITAFRFHYGSAASMVGVIPDLYALGKIIGGGLPAGAYGGRWDIMQYVAPLGGMFQAGTFAGNPLASVAGLATLRTLREENPYREMERLSTDLAQGIEERGGRLRIPLSINRVGGAFTVFFNVDAVSDYTTASRADAVMFGLFHQGLLQRGIYLAPSRFEAWFVSAAHTQDHIDATLIAVEETFQILTAKR